MNYFNYFTEIEEYFVRRRGKHLLVSPMDWSLIATWRDSGIPLHIALRGIDRAMDIFFAKQSRPSRINSLFYCHEAVMEEYANYLDGKVGQAEAEEGKEHSQECASTEPAEHEGPNRASLVIFLEAKISEIKSLAEKHSSEEVGGPRHALDRISSRLAELRDDLQGGGPLDPELLERDLNILEETLVAELRSTVPADQIHDWEAEARKELKVYKKRLPKETYLKIQENYLRGRLHRHFEIGELSLFQL